MVFEVIWFITAHQLTKINKRARRDLRLKFRFMCDASVHCVFVQHLRPVSRRNMVFTECNTDWKILSHFRLKLALS